MVKELTGMSKHLKFYCYAFGQVTSEYCFAKDKLRPRLVIHINKKHDQCVYLMQQTACIVLSPLFLKYLYFPQLMSCTQKSPKLSESYYFTFSRLTPNI